jgi:hypothetical protein
MELTPDDAGKFTVMKATIERFESVDFLSDAFGNAVSSPSFDHLHITEYEPNIPCFWNWRMNVRTVPGCV